MRLVLFIYVGPLAQVLNFSIAYGKTAHGLSRDWGTSLDEAKDTVERWYSDRPEVRAPRLTWLVPRSSIPVVG